MKVKFVVNGQTIEKEIDDSGQTTINLTTDQDPVVSHNGPIHPQDPHREVVRFTKATNVFGTAFDEIERTIIRDDNGKVVDVIDRNLSEEFRKEQREIDKIKKQKESQAKLEETKKQWREKPWYEKIFIIVFLIFCFGLLFLVGCFPDVTLNLMKNFME